MARTFDRLQNIFDLVFPQGVTLRNQLNAREVVGWDSLAHVTLIALTEQEFGIRFDLWEVEATENVGELIQLIDRHLCHRLPEAR